MTQFIWWYLFSFTRAHHLPDWCRTMTAAGCLFQACNITHFVSAMMWCEYLSSHVTCVWSVFVRGSCRCGWPRDLSTSSPLYCLHCIWFSAEISPHFSAIFPSVAVERRPVTHWMLTLHRQDCGTLYIFYSGWIRRYMPYYILGWGIGVVRD